MKKLAISDFKARCLEVLNKMQVDGNPVLITKRGEIIAKVIPFYKKGDIAEEIRRKFEGTFEITGDIVASTWDDDWEEEWLKNWDEQFGDKKK